MTAYVSPLVRHLDDLPVEWWNDPSRGNSTWRTLFSGHVTPTVALSTGVSSVPVGGGLATHRHETVESYFVIAGTGILTLATDEYEVVSGSSVLIPSLATHAIRNTGSTPLNFFYVFAADSFADVEYDFSVG